MAIDGSSLMYSPILRGVDGLSARANVVGFYWDDYVAGVTNSNA